MLLTVDYAFYQSIYFGTLSDAEFKRCSVKASAYLDALTMGRIGQPDLPEWIAEKARFALCAVADAYAKEETGEISSESNDGVSVTYVRSDIKGQGRLYQAAATFLAHTGLLFRGCC